MKFSILIIASALAMTQAASFSDGLVPRFPVDGRIVGGVAAEIEELPYQVSLQKGGHFCGGSIISSKWILSAAHCVGNDSAPTLQIRVGSSFKSSGGDLMKVSQVVQHPAFNDDVIDFDYALIELQDELELSDVIKPVLLADQDEEFEADTKCTVSGWGNTQKPAESTQQLRKVVVPIVSREQCSKSYKGFNEITERMICAGFQKGGKDSCQGDSGGPLVHDDVLIGVVSWGKGCAEKNFPGVYANVAYVRDWIKGVTGV
uniref:trypsin n=1 Tax=Culicoides sonorensis TaxID=179676 RepID=Q5QBF4_CULSO|nr:serine protease [Culicoides sonorensis]